jgi:hypothetical protein
VPAPAQGTITLREFVGILAIPTVNPGHPAQAATGKVQCNESLRGLDHQHIASPCNALNTLRRSIPVDAEILGAARRTQAQLVGQSALESAQWLMRRFHPLSALVRRQMPSHRICAKADTKGVTRVPDGAAVGAASRVAQLIFHNNTE